MLRPESKPEPVEHYADSVHFISAYAQCGSTFCFCHQGQLVDRRISLEINVRQEHTKLATGCPADTTGVIDLGQNQLPGRVGTIHSAGLTKFYAEIILVVIQNDVPAVLFCLLDGWVRIFEDYMPPGVI